MVSVTMGRNRDNNNPLVAWSIVTDFVCAAFPIIIMRKLKMNPRVKLALYAVMSLGLLFVITVPLFDLAMLIWFENQIGH